jgi:hypothetical protein
MPSPQVFVQGTFPNEWKTLATADVDIVVIDGFAAAIARRVRCCSVAEFAGSHADERTSASPGPGAIWCHG